MNDNDFRKMLGDIGGEEPKGEEMDYGKVIGDPEPIIVDPSLFDMLSNDLRQEVEAGVKDSLEDVQFLEAHPYLYGLVAALLEDTWLSYRMSEVVNSKITSEAKEAKLRELIYTAMENVETDDQDFQQDLDEHGSEYARLAMNVIVKKMLNY